MPKYMNNRYLMNLQLFAENGDTGDAGNDSGDGDDQNDDRDDDSGEDGDDEPKYTQADLDKAVARTIAKERAKAERAKKRAAQKSGDSSSDGNEEEDSKLKEAENRALKAEARAACFEAGIDKDAIDDVIALAHAYMSADENLDLEEAIEKVVKKYPHFKKSAADSEEDEGDSKKKSWGERQRGGGSKLTGVEAAFMKKNPGLKI